MAYNFPPGEPDQCRRVSRSAPLKADRAADELKIVPCSVLKLKQRALMIVCSSDRLLVVLPSLGISADGARFAHLAVRP